MLSTPPRLTAKSSKLHTFEELSLSASLIPVRMRAPRLVRTPVACGMENPG